MELKYFAGLFGRGEEYLIGYGGISWIVEKRVEGYHVVLDWILIESMVRLVCSRTS